MRKVKNSLNQFSDSILLTFTRCDFSLFELILDYLNKNPFHSWKNGKLPSLSPADIGKQFFVGEGLKVNENGKQTLTNDN